MSGTQHKLKVLSEIGNRLNREGIEWAVGASLLLYFKGITDKFNDIDIMVAEKDADKVKSVLSRMGILYPQKPNRKYKTRHFLEFSVESVDIDVMAGFVIVNGGREYDCSFDESQIAEYKDVNGVKIPLQKLELWREYYILMGRRAKADMIDRRK